MSKLVVVLLLVLVFATVLFWGRSSWSSYTAKKKQLLRSAASREVHLVHLEEVDGLPEPVKQYFRLVLRDGAPMINQALVSQMGGFRAKPEMKGWSKMKANQSFSTRPRAFMWDARISVIPGVSIRVCDSYMDGKGGMRGKFLSLFTLMDSHSQKELDQAALQRYLAEAAWFPTALLPSQGVTWTALDAHKARATLVDAGVTATLDFEFNEEGEMVSVYAAQRYREVSGEYVSTPWKGRFSEYMQVEGYLIPSEAEVEWHLEEQIFKYWKAKLDDVRYE